MTDLDLIYITGDAANPAGAADRPPPFYDHDTSIFETPYDNFQALRDIALDQARNALSPHSDQLVAAKSLG
jgi:hypothetical protein